MAAMVQQQSKVQLSNRTKVSFAFAPKWFLFKIKPLLIQMTRIYPKGIGEEKNSSTLKIAVPMFDFKGISLS